MEDVGRVSKVQNNLALVRDSLGEDAGLVSVEQNSLVLVRDSREQGVVRVLIQLSNREPVAVGRVCQVEFVVVRSWAMEKEQEECNLYRGRLVFVDQWVLVAVGQKVQILELKVCSSGRYRELGQMVQKVCS